MEAASEAEKAMLDAQLVELKTKLTEAEERGKKAISMAQQTKKGHVYIISNIGSFGQHVYKIGLTRRLDPKERIQGAGRRERAFLLRRARSARVGTMSPAEPRCTSGSSNSR